MFDVAESAHMKGVSDPKNLPHSLLRNYYIHPPAVGVIYGIGVISEFVVGSNVGVLREGESRPAGE